MYLDFTTIHGNVVSNGGGDITLVDGPNGEGIVFPIKDNVIDGNVIVHGWEGAWFGIIRNHVGGNVIASDTVGTRVDENGAPDSTEIVTNQIAGNLICHGNSPQRRSATAAARRTRSAATRSASAREAASSSLRRSGAQALGRRAATARRYVDRFHDRRERHGNRPPR